MLKFKNLFTYFIVPIFLFLLVKLNIGDSIISGWDGELFFLYPDVLLEKAMYLWSDSNSYWAFFSIVQNISFYIVSLILKKIITYSLFNNLFYILGVVFSYYSIIFFLKQFNKFYLKTENIYNDYIYSILWLSYIFSFWYLQLLFRWISFELISFFLIPLWLWYYLKFINWEKYSILFSVFIACFLGINVAHFLIYLLLLLIFSFLDYKKTHKNSIKYFSILFLLSVYWIFPLASTYIYTYKDISWNKYIMDTTVHAEFNQQLFYHKYYNIFQNLSQWLLSNPNYPINKKPLFIIFNFVFIIMILLYLIKNKEKQKQKYFIYFFLIYLLLFQIILWANWFFWSSFTKFVLNTPWMIMFRSVHTKFNYILLILIIALLYIVLSSKKWNLKKIYYLIIFIFLNIWAYWFISNLFDVNIKLSVPWDYVKNIKTLNNKLETNNLKNGFILPKTDLQWQTFSNWWFWGYSFFQQSNNSVWYNTRWTTTMNPNNYYIYKNLIENTDYKFDINSFKRFNYDFFIIQKDFKYNYNNYYTFSNKNEEIKNFLKSNNKQIKKIYDNKYFSLYKVNNFNSLNFSFRNILIKKQTPTRYYLNLNNVKIPSSLNFYKSFHSQWKLYLEPYSPINCSWSTTYSWTLLPEVVWTWIYITKTWDTIDKITKTITWATSYDLISLNPNLWTWRLEKWQEIIIPKIDTHSWETYDVKECPSENKFYVWWELSKLWQKPIFDDTHKMVYDYANSWTIDPEYIKANYPKEYYKENPDWSIDIRLTLYFKPQSYFYLGLIISWTTFLILVFYLIIDSIRVRRKNK